MDEIPRRRDFRLLYFPETTQNEVTFLARLLRYSDLGYDLKILGISEFPEILI